MLCHPAVALCVSREERIEKIRNHWSDLPVEEFKEGEALEQKGKFYLDLCFFELGKKNDLQKKQQGQMKKKQKTTQAES